MSHIVPPKSNTVRGIISALLLSVVALVAVFVYGCTTPTAAGSIGHRTITGPSVLVVGPYNGIATGHVNEELDHHFFIWTVASDKFTDADCLPLSPNIWPRNQVFEVKNGTARFWVSDGEVLCVAPVGKQADISWHFTIEPYPAPPFHVIDGHIKEIK